MDRPAYPQRLDYSGLAGFVPPALPDCHGTIVVHFSPKRKKSRACENPQALDFTGFQRVEVAGFEPAAFWSRRTIIFGYRVHMRNASRAQKIVARMLCFWGSAAARPCQLQHPPPRPPTRQRRGRSSRVGERHTLVTLPATLQYRGNKGNWGNLQFAY